MVQKICPAEELRARLQKTWACKVRALCTIQEERYSLAGKLAALSYLLLLAARVVALAHFVRSSTCLLSLRTTISHLHSAYPFCESLRNLGVPTVREPTLELVPRSSGIDLGYNAKFIRFAPSAAQRGIQPIVQGYDFLNLRFCLFAREKECFWSYSCYYPHMLLHLIFFLNSRFLPFSANVVQETLGNPQ